MGDTVSWSTVRATAKAVSDRMPQVSRDELDELADDLVDLVPQALEQVEEYTDLRADAGVAPFRVVSRLDWVDANLDSYRYLIDRASQLIGPR
ncbi:MAG: zinc-dependent metalloprotease, partial [Acidimicrobiales bacterium]